MTAIRIWAIAFLSLLTGGGTALITFYAHSEVTADIAATILLSNTLIWFVLGLMLTRDKAED